MDEKKSLLIVDDEPNIRRVLEAVFTKDGYQVRTAENGRKALDIVATEPGLNVVICDLIMPDMNGVEVLEAAKEINPRLSLVMITAHGTIKTAVDAMKLGAFDYITKPFDMDEIKLVVKNALERSRLLEENVELRQELKSRYKFDNIVGSSGKMQEVYRIIERVAASNATVLIRGESGTGKELIARAIHYNSPRAQKPFIAVSCAALPETLLESELFGHEKGSFTGATGQKIGRFELATQGTLFLDEIPEVSPGVQVKLLRALQEREFERVGGTKTVKVDVRLIAATNRDLEQLVADGVFRADLYYRLQVIQVFLPSLRERMEDIAPLVEHFIQKFNKENGKAVKFLSPEAMDLVMKYEWPGNIRELENAIERCVVLADPASDLVTPDLLPFAVQAAGERS
ncbi:MAG: sigma-54-dependent Fis family transcriptional regulator [Armatimonadetes bacterium]|nr:sigma-54-dependent Fis family transcriptional regulator [Armatimonadota bacterium]